MNKLSYFINKIWTFAVTIHPLTYIVLLVISVIMFFLFKKRIQKFRPQTNYQNTITILLIVFFGLPILGLLLLFIVSQILNNQQF